MTNLGLPVPPGFTITTEACNAYMAGGDQLPAGLMDEVARRPRARSSRRWASSSATAADPLLVSVRSGAPFSMPGMMDTVLNLGLNDESVQGPREADAATSASRTTRTAASCRCSARSCSTSPATSSRRRCTTSSRTKGLTRRHRAQRRRPRAASSRRSRGSCATKRASTSPTTRTSSCATRSKRCSSRGTASAPRDYRRIERHRRRPRHRGQRADDGVRQQGRRLRHRRRVHAQPVDR